MSEVQSASTFGRRARALLFLLLLLGAACDVSVPNREPCQSDRDCPRGQRCAEARCEVYPRAEGGVCASGDDCLSAFCTDGFCRTPCVDGACRESEYCSSGACLPRRPTGAPCTNAMMCAAGASCVDNVCRTPCTVGDDGPCATGEYCLEGACAPGLDNGAACFRPRMCKSQLCVENACRAACPAGRDDECAGDEYCEIGVCVPRGPAGRSCLRDDQCASGACVGGACQATTCPGGDDALCATSEYCDGQRCHARGSAGEPCARDRACASDACIESRCRAACDVDARCARDEYCDGARCKPAQSAGSDCARDTQCAGALCFEGRCRARCEAPGDPACAADEQCATLWCVPKEPAGALCGSDAACASGFCVGARCRASCINDGDVSCSAGEACDGQRCVPQSPVGASCARDAACASGACGGGVCRATCADGRDLSCGANEYCAGGVCAPLRTAASSCARNGECAGGACVGSICRAACVGTLDGPCASNEACDGAHCMPKSAAGSACTRSAECQSAQCTALVCRGLCTTGGDGACDASEYCSVGVCAPRAPIGATCDRDRACGSGACSTGLCRATCSGSDDGPCASTEYCSGTRCILRNTGGTSCPRDRVCQSGFCVNGICCQSRCATCQRCDVTPGNCAPAATGSVDDRCAASSPSACGYSGACDGAGHCALYDNHTSCAGPTCAADGLSSGGVCTGLGQCALATPSPCAPYGCDASGTACRSSCAAAADCAAGYTCEGGACRGFRVATFAGGGAGDGAAATAANLKRPVKLALATENGARVLYVADADAHRIRRVNLSTGLITTVAGTGVAGASPEGTVATSARLRSPQGVTLSSAGLVHFADTGNHRVLRLETSGTLTRLIGSGVAGYGGDGRRGVDGVLDTPRDLVFDDVGNLYVSDSNNHRIRQLAPAGLLSTYAGIGIPGYLGEGITSALSEINYPDGLAWDPGQSDLYFADQNNQRFRKVRRNGQLTTVAGTGVAGYNGENLSPTLSQVDTPSGIAWTGSVPLFADTGNHRIRTLTASELVTIVGNGTAGFSGDGSAATAAQLSGPRDVAYDSNGVKYIADTGNRRVRRVDAGGVITTIAGNGYLAYSGDGLAPTAASLGGVGALALASSGDVYVTQTEPPVIRKISVNVVSTFAGRPGQASGCAPDGALSVTALGTPSGIAVFGTDVYFADRQCHVVRKISGGQIRTVAGSLGLSGNTGDGGPAVSARLFAPTALVVDATGRLYVADTGNHRVRLVSSGNITTVAGSGRDRYSGDGGLATAAGVPSPLALALHPSGDLLVADASLRVRRVAQASNVITTYAGNGGELGPYDGLAAQSAPLGLVTGIAFDTRGNAFFSLGDAPRIVARSASTGLLLTIAGDGSTDEPASGSSATTVGLLGPRALVLHPGEGRLYFVDGPETAGDTESHLRRLE